MEEWDADFPKSVIFDLKEPFSNNKKAVPEDKRLYILRKKNGSFVNLCKIKRKDSPAPFRDADFPKSVILVKVLLPKTSD